MQTRNYFYDIRHVLLRIAGGYVAINCYHHAAGDGTSGILMINSILSNYDILYNGGSLERKSNKPLPSIEDLTWSVKNDQVLKTLVDSKIERARSYRPRLPFSLEELEENYGAEIPLNKSIIRTGTEDNYQAIRLIENVSNDYPNIDQSKIKLSWCVFSSCDFVNFLSW